MLAVTIVDGRLELAELADPEPRPHEVVIGVRAAGLNRADLAVRRGLYRTIAQPPPGPQVAGGECAGEVVAVGADVEANREESGLTPLRVGDRAMAMARGSYAEQVAVDARMAMPVPPDWSWEEAGAAPVTFVTAHDAIATAGRHEAGGSVLVNAASSGVGVAALQIARALGASPLIAVSRSQDKLDRMAAAGIAFDAGLLSTDPADVARVTADRGVDLVIDSVGAGTLMANVTAAALGGRIVSVGRLAGVRDELDLDELARKRISLVGVTFRTRSGDQARAVVATFWRALGPALHDGSLRPLVAETFPLQAAEAAQARLAENAHVGKVVLRVGG
jgi:NADPH2:quinone reductase